MKRIEMPFFWSRCWYVIFEPKKVLNGFAFYIYSVDSVQCVLFHMMHVAAAPESGTGKYRYNWGCFLTQPSLIM